jgi:voltage-gated potassium channel
VIERLRNHRHLVLLAVLLLALIAQPLVAHESRAARVGFELLFGLSLMATLLVVFGPRERRYAAVLLLPLLALAVTEYAVSARSFTLTAVGYHLMVALFVGLAVAVLVRDIFRHRSIGFDDILGAFAGYILLGVAWGSLYATVELLAPGSFSVSPEIRWQLEDWHLRRALFIYFSFTTMSSLGYNDITPAAPIANTLTWIEVMTAQFYLAVVIAQIVGMKLAQAIEGGRPRAD